MTAMCSGLNTNRKSVVSEVTNALSVCIMDESITSSLAENNLQILYI